jgi:hypothetical protein
LVYRGLYLWHGDAAFFLQGVISREKTVEYVVQIEEKRKRNGGSPASTHKKSTVL